MTPAPETPRASRIRRQAEAFGTLKRLGALLAGFVVIIAVIFCVLIKKLERSPPVHPEDAKKTESLVVAKGGFTAPIQGIAGLEKKRPLIEAALKDFFKATTVEEKLRVSRDMDRVRPLMRGYYTKQPLRPRMVKSLGTCQSVNEKGYRLGYVEVLFTKGNPINIIVEEKEDGQFCADWESLVRYSEMEWSDFLRVRPQEPILMRVIASQTTVAPAHGQEWLELVSPGHATPLKAYFDRNAPEFQALVQQLELGGWKKVPLTLRLCYSELKLNADSARIAGVEGKGWLILN